MLYMAALGVKGSSSSSYSAPIEAADIVNHPLTRAKKATHKQYIVYKEWRDSIGNLSYIVSTFRAFFSKFSCLVLFSFGIQPTKFKITEQNNTMTFET